MTQKPVVGGSADEPANETTSKVIKLTRRYSPYVALLTEGLPPIEVVLALIKLGYQKTHESEYGNHYTTQFTKKTDRV